MKTNHHFPLLSGDRKITKKSTGIEASGSIDSSLIRVTLI
jgi:hypothetical protein